MTIPTLFKKISTFLRLFFVKLELNTAVIPRPCFEDVFGIALRNSIFLSKLIYFFDLIPATKLITFGFLC